jgi:hypothetical protein
MLWEEQDFLVYIYCIGDECIDVVCGVFIVVGGSIGLSVVVWDYVTVTP